MNRGALVSVIVVAETAFAALCAAVFGFVIAAGDAYAQRSGNLHGGVPPMTQAERAEVHAAGYWAFGVGFVVMLAGELALTAFVFHLIRRDRGRASRQQSDRR